MYFLAVISQIQIYHLPNFHFRRLYKVNRYTSFWSTVQVFMDEIIGKLRLSSFSYFVGNFFSCASAGLSKEAGCW